MGTPRSEEQLRRFAQDLRLLVEKSGLSFRALAAKAHYSRTAFSQAASGRTLPSLPVTLAFVDACGGNRLEWQSRWHDLHRMLSGTALVVVAAPPAWPAQEVVDGAEPESAGCTRDAVTVHARRIALSKRYHIIGQIELRYSASAHAAWGRFEGFGNLDHLAAQRHHVEILVEVVREPPGSRITFLEDYTFEYHWTDLLRTGEGTYYSMATVYFDGEAVAQGETDQFALD
jgi:hypothetical protein